MGFSAEYFQSAFNSLNMDFMTMIRIVLSLVCMHKVADLTRQDLPVSPEDTPYFQRATGYAYLVILIALCWISLLATDALATFAYFQF